MMIFIHCCRSLRLSACIAYLLWAAPAQTAMLSDNKLAGMELVGAASFKWLFWRLFDAELRSSEPSFDWDRPLALVITYRTDFSSEELTQATLDEMRRVTSWETARIEVLREPVARCMADVSAGDTFTAVSEDDASVRLYLNRDHRCTLSAPGLKRAYLGIWLSERSRYPEQSLALCGEK